MYVETECKLEKNVKLSIILCNNWLLVSICNLINRFSILIRHLNILFIFPKAYVSKPRGFLFCVGW